MNAMTIRLLLLPLFCLALNACSDRRDVDDDIDDDTIAAQEEPGGLTPGERMEQEEREKEEAMRREEEREEEEPDDEPDDEPEEEPTPQAYKRYTNPRFHYTLLYPTRLRPQVESDNGDGRRFVSADGDIVMTAHGRYLLQQESLRDLYAARRAELGGEVTYAVVRNGFYVISGRENGTIFYEKTVKHVGIAATLLLRYPASRKKELDPVVTRVAGSFRLGDEE
jgi:hypothetical protein